MDDLDRLWLGAALTSGWPTLRVAVPDEAALLRARATAEASLGPLPQAIEWEPWDDGDAWSLEVDLPDVAPERLVQALTALQDAGFDAQIRPGLRPGAAWADARGARVEDRLGTGPIQAVLAVDPTLGGDGRPDVRVASADLTEVACELTAAFQEAGLTAAFGSDAGPDTVEPVIHRATGRRGLRIHVTGPDVDRHRVVDAIGAVILARAHSDTVRLAPDLRWDVATGFTVTAWVIAPPHPPPAGDRLDPARRDDLVALIHGLGGATDTLEVHAVPARPERTDAAIEAVAAWPLPGIGLTGGPGRWVGTPPRFAVTWTLPANVRGTTVADWATRVATSPDVAVLRVVPGAPAGLEDRWPRLDVAWRSYGDTVFMRLRDWIADRDVLPVGRSAAPPPWSVAFAGLPGVHDLRGVADDAGRVGLALRLDPDAADPSVLDGILAALARARPAPMSTLGIFGMRGDHPVVHLRPAHGTR